MTCEVARAYYAQRGWRHRRWLMRNRLMGTQLIGPLIERLRIVCHCKAGLLVITHLRGL
jgi:hypothetical protein